MIDSNFIDEIERNNKKKRLISKSIDLTNVLTCHLIDEVIKRPGVKVDYVDPHEDFSLSVNGPAIVLTVID